MTLNVIDTPKKITAAIAAELKQNGVTHVGRYLAGREPWLWKGLTIDEAKTILASGLNLFSIFEKGPTEVSYFTSAQAQKDAKDAMDWAKAVGQPNGTAIYFTVDYDAQSKDFPSILAYFKALKSSLNGYKIGAYGKYDVLNMLHANNAADYWFQTIAWSGGKRCSFNNLYQFQCDKTMCGIDVDFNNIEKDTADIGAWNQPPNYIGTIKVNIQSGFLNVRDKPDISGSIIGKFKAGDPTEYKVYEKRFGWYKVSMPGAIPGWVSENYVVFKPV